MDRVFTIISWLGDWLKFHFLMN